LGDLCLLLSGQDADDSHSNRYMDEALQHFSIVLKSDPDHVLASNNVAWILATRQGQLEQALLVAERARGKVSTSRLPLFFIDTLADLYRQAERWEEAQSLIESARRDRPQEALLAYHEGMILASLGRDLPARRELRAALRSGLPAAKADQAVAQLRSMEQPREQGEKRE
jgi:tetratricopeptide (TPR) repeat protein